MAYEKALSLLSEVFGNRLSRSSSDLDLHGTSEAHFPVTSPDAVAYVNSTEDVKKLIGVCYEQECPVIAWGTGTSLEGHSLAPRGGVSVDFSQMNRVIKINAEDMTAIVEPGVTREALNEELRATGLFFSSRPWG
jgi:D-lactate dehydrogenase (cytochrome)